MSLLRRRIVIRVGLVTVVVLLAAAAFFLAYGVRWFGKFDRWVTAEPVRVGIDLSQAATVEGRFEQTCAIAHAQTVELRPVQPEDKNRLRDAAEAAGMSIRLYTPGGLSNLAIVDPPLECPEEAAAVQVFRLRPVPDGVYRFVVRTERPGDLRPLPALVCVRNELCGLERMPGTIAVGIGVALGFFGLVTGGIVLAARGSRVAALDTDGVTPSQSP